MLTCPVSNKPVDIVELTKGRVWQVRSWGGRWYLTKLFEDYGEAHTARAEFNFGAFTRDNNRLVGSGWATEHLSTEDADAFEEAIKPKRQRAKAKKSS